MTLTNKMFTPVAVIVFLFLARVQFSTSTSLAEAVRSLYNENTVQKKKRKLEKLDYCLLKEELDL